MFYVISCNNGFKAYGNFASLSEAKNYAESCSLGWNYEIDCYENEEEYFKDNKGE